MRNNSCYFILFFFGNLRRHTVLRWHVEHKIEMFAKISLEMIYIILLHIDIIDTPIQKTAPFHPFYPSILKFSEIGALQNSYNEYALANPGQD